MTRPTTGPHLVRNHSRCFQVRGCFGGLAGVRFTAGPAALRLAFTSALLRRRSRSQPYEGTHSPERRLNSERLRTGVDALRLWRTSR